MRRDEKSSSTLRNWLISYTLHLSFSYTASNTEIKPVINQFHSADFTLNVGSPCSLAPPLSFNPLQCLEIDSSINSEPRVIEDKRLCLGC